MRCQMLGTTKKCATAMAAANTLTLMSRVPYHGRPRQRGDFMSTSAAMQVVLPASSQGLARRARCSGSAQHID